MFSDCVAKVCVQSMVRVHIRLALSANEFCSRARPNIVLIVWSLIRIDVVARRLHRLRKQPLRARTQGAEGVAVESVRIWR